MSAHSSAEYERFIKSKLAADVPTGFDYDVPVGPLFDFQAACVKWALKRGRAALFLDTGLGKTLCQCTWAQLVHEHTGQNIIIAAPLCVAQQTVEEAAKFGITVKYCRSQDQVEPGITITNYEMLGHFDLDSFVGVVLDESSILKSHTSRTREEIVSAFRNTPYKLSCTATPSPNDYIELGNQADFLGVMSAQEMLATFFTHDGGDTSKWRLKGHGKTRFWEWMASWSICIRNPADLGFDGSAYELPPLNIIEHTVSGGDLLEGQLFAVVAQSLSERREAKRNSMADRVQKTANIIYASSVRGTKMADNKTRTDNSYALEAGIRSESKTKVSGRSGISGAAECSVDERQGSAQRLYAGLLLEESIEIQAHTGPTGGTQRSQEKEVCRERGDAGVRPAEGAGMAGVESGSEEGSKDFEVWADAGSVPPNAGITGRPVSNLRSQRPIGQESIPPCGSLPLDGEGSRADLHELQSGPREIQGQHAVLDECDRVFEASAGPWLIWCHLNDEQDELEKALGTSCFSVRGATPPQEKEASILGWLRGERPIMISKPSIMGFGLNFQHCNNMIFAGMDDSFEKFYQAVRRCYRFGQKRVVNVHIITADTEGAVKANIERKQRQANEMAGEMVAHMRGITRRQIEGARSNTETYAPTVPIELPKWIISCT